MYFKDDGDYVDPSEGRGQLRPNYESARPLLETRQKMTRSNSGNHMTFESAVTPGHMNQLDSRGRESILKRKADSSGNPQYIKRKPAMDHIIQVAAIKESYNGRVMEERRKGLGGLSRTSSFDLHEAYKGAIADPDNLRLVTHSEHTSMGGTTRMGGFTKTEMRDASNLFEKHMPTTPSTPTQEYAFTSNFPSSAFPRTHSTQPIRRQPSRRAKNKIP